LTIGARSTNRHGPLLSNNAYYAGVAGMMGCHDRALVAQAGTQQDTQEAAQFAAFTAGTYSERHRTDNNLFK